MSWWEIPNNETFEGYDLSKLRADQYLLRFADNYRNLILCSKVDECVDCPFINCIDDVSESLRVMSAKWNSVWRVRNLYDPNDIVCDIRPDVAEFGVYVLNISKNDCTLHTLLEPVNIYLSILNVILIVLGIWIFLYFLYWFLKREIPKRKGNDQDEQEVPEKVKNRVRSLDTFRGISITMMIFVNYGAGNYNFFKHSVWNGLNVADLVFPSFMWIMGVCIPISVKSALRRNDTAQFIMLNIFKRSCILFLLGLALNHVSIIQNLRIFGVLQRFALCYFFVATLQLIFTKKVEPQTQKSLFKDLKILMWQWLIILIVLVIHTAIVFGVPFEDCPRGYLGPGGLHDFGKYMNCTGGVTGYVDRLVLGTEHMLNVRLSTFYPVYHSITFDPESILGTLTSIVQVFIGVQAGVMIQVYKGHKSRIARWLIWALVTGVIGGCLCGFSRDDGIIPINKKLWSLSFVLVTTCVAFIVLTICYVLIDVKYWWRGNPFVYAGMNAIILYVGHSVTRVMFPFQWSASYHQTHFQSLVAATWGTFAWLVVAYWLYTKKFFLSI